MNRFTSIMLGDNPFFGVDHLSHERARERDSQFQSFDKAVEIVKCAHEYGMKEMVVGTRPRLPELLNTIRNKSNLLREIQFNPILPYAQDYVLKLSEKGMIGAIKEILSGAGIQKELSIITKSGLGFLKKDLGDLFKLLIDVELIKLKTVKIKTVYLHPLVTDLALALNLKGIFETFKEQIENKYDVNSGLVTKNFSALILKLNEWDLKFTDIMTSFNRAGFLMNPSKDACERTLLNYDNGVTAMNIFAGGYLEFEDAVNYVNSLAKLNKIVIGASSIEHVKQTFQYFNKL